MARTLVFGLACYAANAAAVDVVVALSGPQQEVPISPWAVVTIAAIVAGIAHRTLKGRMGAGLRSLLVAAAVGASLLALDVARDLVSRVWADYPPPGQLQLVTSPAHYTVPPLVIWNMVQSGGGHRIYVTNSSGVPVTILSRWFEGNSTANPLLFYPPPSSVPQCDPGFRLEVGATCNIDIHPSASWG